MKPNRLLLSTMIAALALPSCDNSSDPSNTIPDESDGRVTVTNDPEVLDDRVTEKDEFIELDTAGTGKRAGTVAFSLKLLAEISPPSVGGTPVQATSVSLNGGFAYVSYNLQGGTYKGAIDVVQPKGGKNATLKSSATFTDTDIHAVYYDEGYVFVAEASENVLDPRTAYVERLGTSGPDKLTLKGKLRTALESFVATSVAADGGNVYVTTGNTGYIYRLDQSTLTVGDSVSLDDARWVHATETEIVVMQGTPGRFSHRSAANLSAFGAFSFTGATIAESKSTVQLIGGKALIAAGDGGVRLVNVSTGVQVGSIAAVTVPGLDPSLTVTNAVQASGSYLFISNGEAGVYVARASRPLEELSGDSQITLTTLGKLQFASQQSVNHVAYDGSNLIVASGAGGVKIVEVDF